MSNEVWVQIPSLPEYSASSKGRLMRAESVGTMPNGGRRKYGGIPILGANAKGRRIISCHGKTYKVHRLVCEAFNGPSPFEGAVVMHIDENYHNNEPANLKWATQKENLNSPGYLREMKKRVRSLSEIQVADIRHRRAKGDLLTAIGKDYGMSMQNISDIARGRSYNDYAPEFR